MTEGCGCPIKEKLRPLFLEYIGTTRALHLWFHGAHHVTRGSGFLGDHIHLYGEVYKKIQDDIDVVIEKAVSILEDESVACPAKITDIACDILNEFPSPSDHTALAIAAHAKTLMVSYLQMLDSMFHEIQQIDAMTLGLEDHISSTCNEYESFVYLLQQREKSELEN